MIKPLAVVFLATTLTACSLFDKVKQVVVSAPPVEQPKLVLPKVDELSLRPVTWVIITKETYQEKLAELEKSGEPVAIFGITGTGYTNLSINMSQLRQLIEQQQSIIEAYEKYYIATEQTTESTQ